MLKTKNKKNLQIFSDLVYHLNCCFIASIFDLKKNKRTHINEIILYYKKKDGMKLIGDYTFIDNLYNENNKKIFNVVWEKLKDKESNNKLNDRILIVKLII